MKPAARLYVEAPLAPGAGVALTEGQAHYLRSVLRLEPGRRVLLFNGRDGEWLADLGELRKSGGVAVAVSQRRAQAPEPDLWLLFAPIKGDRIDTIAEKATELGAARLQPVMTRHTVVTRVNVERLQARAIEAAEQCERLTVPEIVEPRSLREALQGWPDGRRLFACAEAGPARPMAEVLAVGPRNAPSGLLVGPEGGFSPDELDLLRELAFVTAVGLGPRLLRADTAAIAALALWQALGGDGDRRPPQRIEN
ncbi:MAG: rRNA methyltransferase [Rhodospirillales bacterium]|nr:rRNA methyltransferase [Rhodospirillales bacterium]